MQSFLPVSRGVLFLALMLLPFASSAVFTADDAAMNQPQQPFRIIGDIYYVGAADVTSYLIVTPQGDILLDSGFAETVPQVRANIAALGFKLADVKILLTSQTHYDHVGGMAEMKRLTHARLEATEAAAEQMAEGGKDDYGFYDHLTYQPVQTDKLLADGDKVELGGVTLIAHLTPGHTKGCTTWTMTAEEGGKPYHVVFLCGVTVPGYTLVGNTGYPNIVSDYERSFALLRALPCDVFLGAHGQYFNLQAKLANQRAHPGTNPFIDPAGYQRYLDDSEQDFLKLVKQQQSAASTAQH